MKSLEEISRELVWQVPAFRATIRDRINHLRTLGAEARKQGQIQQADDWDWEACELQIAWEKYSSEEL